MATIAGAYGGVRLGRLDSVNAHTIDEILRNALRLEVDEASRIGEPAN